MPIRKVISRSIQDGATATADLAAGSVTPAKIQTGVDFTFNTLTVGKGGGSISTNTAAGVSALAANTTGANNTAVGYLAMQSVTTGPRNTAIGRNALNLLVTNNDNTAVGHASLENNTGGYNTAVGTQSLQANTTASNNTAVGYQAGYTQTTATATAFFGYQAGNLNTGSQVTGIGSSALFNNTGDDNTAVGQTALFANTSGANNTAVGRQALRLSTTASNNTAVGYQAGYGNTTGTENVYIGQGSGYTSTTGSYNVCVGRVAGYNITTGTFNTIVGMSAGDQITTGSKNTILGRYNGNQGGLDIRTASNNIVLSDGDGNPRIVVDSGGNTNIGGVSAPNTGSLSNRFLQLVANGYGSVGAASSNAILNFTCNIPSNTATTFLTCADIDKWGGVILISYVRDADQNRSGMMMVRYRYNRLYTTLLNDSQNSGATFSVSANNLQVTIGGAGTYLCQFTIWGSAGP